MKPFSPVETAPAEKRWPPELSDSARSNFGSFSLPWLSNGPGELDRDRVAQPLAAR